MSNIRLFYPESLSINLEGKLDKAQSHYLTKVMRIPIGGNFSLFNKFGEWQTIIKKISKNDLNFKVTKQLRHEENETDLWLAFSPIKSNFFNFMIQKATELGVTKFIPVITERTVVNSGINAPREIWPVDLDLDGDMDIIAGIYYDQDLVWFENNGSQSFTKRTVDGSLGGNANSVLAVDLDGDNDLDIVCGTYSSSVLFWFENDGSQSFTRYTIASGLTASPVAIDLDEDGDLDLVGRVNDGSERIVWWENNGSESFTLNQIDNSKAGLLNVADLDEDGDYDVITTDVTNGHVNWYANNGSESFTKNTVDNSGMTSAYQVEVGDIDGDGDIDIAAQTASNNSTADDKIVWYANNGSESFTEYDVDTDLSYPYRFNLVDIDGDEDLDMVTAARQGDEVVWYENVDAGYVLGLSLSGTPNGSETVTVSPVSSAIFDVAGNAASTSQSNNTASLNASNYVLNLNGSNEYAYYADNSNFEPSNWSIQAWIDPSAVPTNSDNDYFIHKNKTYRLGLEYTSSGVEVMGSLRYSGSYYDVNSGDQNFYVTAGGGWYHVVLTFDGTNLILYVNGDEKDTNSNSNYSTTNQTGVFSIGRRHDTQALYYNGKIDEVTLWNTALSSNAVAALYNSGTGLSASTNSGNYTSSGNLVLYLKMDQNLEDSANSYDFTGNNISSGDYDNTGYE